MRTLLNLLFGTCFFLGQVASLCAQQPPPVPPPTSPDAPVMIVGTPPPPPPPPDWCGSVEFGLSGAEGNSQLFKLRAAATAKYETKEHLFKNEFLYAFANANNERTENRALLTSRYERLLGDTPWSIFVRGELLYDEFTAYDARIGLHAGLSYTFLKNDTTLFKTRVGAGASREIGGPENRVMPEGLLGADFEHKFTERQKFAANVDFFPDFGEFGEYRAEIRACYEILVDPEWNLTFKVGLLDRYDSTPEGRKPNDIEYFGLLVWKF